MNSPQQSMSMRTLKMRQHETKANVHVSRSKKPHAQLLRQPRKRAALPRMEGGARSLQAKPRPFQMPPQKAVRSKSYTMRNLICALFTVAVVFGLIWSYGLIYQVGYKAAETYYQQEEVRHG